MLNDDDIQKLKGVFATKDDLKKFATKDDLAKAQERNFEFFASKEDIKQLATKDELHEFRDEVLNGLDKVMGELQEIRLDQTVSRQRHEDLEDRVSKIEHIPAIAHELHKP